MVKNKLLYATLLLILLTLLVRWWTKKRFSQNKINEKYIERVIKKEVALQEFKIAPILDSLSTVGHLSVQENFQKLYPFFVYQNGIPFFWSDFKFLPKYSTINKKEKYFFIEKSYGQFIVRKWAIKHKKKQFEVFSFITLFRKYPINNNYIQSKLNPKFGQKEKIKFTSPQSNLNYYAVKINGKEICKINVEKGYKPAIIQPIFFIDVFLLILQILCYYAIYRLVLREKKSFEVFVLILGWAYFKLVLPSMEGITEFASINLFDSQYYAVSWFERSIADLLINTLFILLISLRFSIWVKNKKILPLFLNRSKKHVSTILFLAFSFFSFWVINYPFFQLRSIYKNSQVLVDITQSLEFDWARIIIFIIIVLINLSTFLLYHTIAKYLVKYMPSFNKLAVLLFAATLLYLPLSYITNMPFANLAIVNVFIMVTLRLFNFVQLLKNSTYKRFLYIFLFLGALSVINGFVIKDFEKEKKIEKLENTLTKKLSNTDPFSEFLLSTALKDLASDQFIRSSFLSPFLSKNTSVSKIKQVFLNSYLNKYEQFVKLYDAKGIILRGDRNEPTIFEKIESLKGLKYKTEYPTIFRIEDNKHNFSKQYLGYIPIKRKHLISGYVLIKLVEKQVSSSLVYPSLLIDNKFQLESSKEKNFAYYINGKMVNTIGVNQFPKFIKKGASSWFKNNLIYVSKSDNERVIIASAGFNQVRIILSNFSFIWLITLFPSILILFIIPYLEKGKLKAISYTERIIWYLNLVFIVPLILVTGVTFRLLSSSFEAEFNHTKKNLVERLSNQISSSLADYLKDGKNYEKHLEQLEILSNNAQLDINVYNLKGNLISSSQPSVFSKKVLAPYINKYALDVIKEKKKNQLLLQESIDKLIFNNLYAAIKAEETGQILGIISVPFFNTNTLLISSKREAFNTILIVFVLVFFITMLATYFAGKWLTSPLKLIGDKLKATNFLEQTEPINIQWSDEIGMLIKGYNQMLNKLEKSKIDLKQSEKEKAWREAAQQVAHEIKNPLTPMKLTLQRITNKINIDKTKTKELEAPLQSVLAQVETLNSIASSFSEFAKMPTPIMERVNVHTIIKKEVELFKSDKELKIKLHLANQQVHSLLDSKLFSRIFNNLLLNAKQAIQKNQDFVEVEIATTVNSEIKILIKDNGIGIDPNIADKVFIPKFTTKEHGSGIGLAMTKYSIENMHGAIGFTSILKEGTTFTIEFPIID